MATVLTATIKQSFGERRQWDFDFSPDLPEGVTITSATATHVPPSGSAVTPSVAGISGGIVSVLLNDITQVTGYHQLRCLANYSDGQKSEIILKIEVVA
jgi:hypothetical protein